MNQQAPKLLDLGKADGESLVQVAEKILGNGAVAATNADRRVTA